MLFTFWIMIALALAFVFLCAAHSSSLAERRAEQADPFTAWCATQPQTPNLETGVVRNLDCHQSSSKDVTAPDAPSAPVSALSVSRA